MTQTLESYFNKLISEMDQTKLSNVANESHLIDIHKKV